MERKVKVGDRIKIINPLMTDDMYKKGDVLTVMKVDYAGVWVVENDWYIDRSEFEIITDEIITDEIKPGDTVTLIDKPWEWDGWAKLTRKRRLIYKGFMGKENEVICIFKRSQVNISELQGYVCADIGCYYIVPLDILRKVEPVKVPFDVEPEPVKAEPKRVQMTDEPHPEIKEGARFVVVNKPDNTALKIGDVLVLRKNDHSKCPSFYHNDKMRCEWWKSLAPLEAKHRYTDEQINEAKMIIGRLVADLEQATGLAFIEDGNLTRLYIDGRKVSEAKCSPQDEPNRAIGRMVAMLKRFDDPLPTWIRG